MYCFFLKLSEGSHRPNHFQIVRQGSQSFSRSIAYAGRILILCLLRHWSLCHLDFSIIPNIADWCTKFPQIYNWLSNSPSEMESYIRPGCVVLSIYLSMTSAAWEQVSSLLYYREMTFLMEVWMTICWVFVILDGREFSPTSWSLVTVFWCWVLEKWEVFSEHWKAASYSQGW